MFRQTLLLLVMLVTARTVTAELRDPTRPANAEVNQGQIANTPSGEIALNLTEVRIAGRHRRAIINGELVKIGQTLADGSQVVSIQSHQVSVRQNGTNKKLFLVPTVKLPVK